jgi:hypothetical protein
MKPTAVVSNSAFIEHGLNEIFGQELSTLRKGEEALQMTLQNLRESAFRNLGQPETRGMYVRSGRAAFYYWMRQHAEGLGWLEVEFRLLPAPARIKRAMTDALKWFEDEKFLKGELFSKDEVWLISVTGLVGEGASLECNTFIGLLQELACWAGAGKFYAAREIECQSAGADFCIFEICKQPAG